MNPFIIIVFSFFIIYFYILVYIIRTSYQRPLCRDSGFPSGASGKESICQWRRHKRHGFNPWIRKIPWRREWQPTPILLPGEWTEELGRLQLIGSQRVGHDWSSLVHTYAYMGSGIPFLPWELFMFHNMHTWTLTHTHTHTHTHTPTGVMLLLLLSAAIIRKTMTQCKLSMFCQCQWLSFLQNCSNSA